MHKFEMVSQAKVTFTSLSKTDLWGEYQCLVLYRKRAQPQFFYIPKLDLIESTPNDLRKMKEAEFDARRVASAIIDKREIWDLINSQYSASVVDGVLDCLGCEEDEGFPIFHHRLLIEPFWMLVGCLFLPKADWSICRKVLGQVKAHNTSYDLAKAKKKDDLARMMKPIGSVDKLIALAQAWSEEARPSKVSSDHIRKMGFSKFAADSWSIFIEGKRPSNPAKILRRYLSLSSSDRERIYLMRTSQTSKAKKPSELPSALGNTVNDPPAKKASAKSTKKAPAKKAPAKSTKKAPAKAKVRSCQPNHQAPGLQEG